MLKQSVTHTPRPEYPLHITAKRYWLPEFQNSQNDPTALTLIFLHSTSFHKETWEPCIERIFSLASRDPAVKVREAWALDCPNHGESAALNEEGLRRPEFFLSFSCEKYAESAYKFLSAGPDHGACVDFRNRNLVGVGHSLGGVAMSILPDIEPLLPFSSIIVVEPMLSPAGPDHLSDLRARLLKGAAARHDVWASREEARKSLKASRHTAKWDPRILDLFVSHALRRQSTSYYIDSLPDGVTLCCTREQEAVMYRDADGPTKPVKDLDRVCARIPVHLILGAINDFIPQQVHGTLIRGNPGRRFASIITLDGVGHLIPQEVPDRLGHVVFDALLWNANTSRSKL